MSSILESGSWSGDTLTEDMDMALSAASRGWRFLMLPHVEVPLFSPISLTSSFYLVLNFPTNLVLMHIDYLSSSPTLPYYFPPTSTHLLQCSSELPSTLSAYRKQQYRWACGPAALLRKHWNSLWEAQVEAPSFLSFAFSPNNFFHFTCYRCLPEILFKNKLSLFINNFSLFFCKSWF